MDDWRLRIHECLSRSRVFLAFVSPTYLFRPWCLREWQLWAEREIALQILSRGVLPIVVVEVPQLRDQVDDRDVAIALAEQSSSPSMNITETAAVIGQIRRRQLISITSHYQAGLAEFTRAELQHAIGGISEQLARQSQLIQTARKSPGYVRPYNDKFTGRIKELLTLREKLLVGGASVISAIHGLGGIGKTELALTYAHAFASEYPGGRFEVPCEGMTDLKQTMLPIANLYEFRKRIGEEQRRTADDQFDAIVACLREQLATQGAVLILLDNITSSELLSAAQIDILISLGPNLHLLATTRQSAGSAVGTTWHTLHELTDTDSVELLLKFRSAEDDTDLAAAHGIARRLGGFTLTVELVGAWLSAKPEVSYSAMLDRLGLEDLETLDEIAADADPSVELRRHNDVRRLDAILGPTISNLTPIAREALAFAALLSPDHVPLPWLRSLIQARFTSEGKAGIADEGENALRELIRFALLRCDGRSPVAKMHRLVQEYVLNVEPDHQTEDRRLAVGALIRMRDGALQDTGWLEESRWEVAALEALANRWADDGHQSASWMLSDAGLLLFRLAEWTRAESLYIRAIADGEGIYGPESAEVATYLSNPSRTIPGYRPIRGCVSVDTQSDKHKSECAGATASECGKGSKQFGSLSESDKSNSGG